MKNITLFLIAIFCLTTNLLAQNIETKNRKFDLQFDINSTIPIQANKTFLNEDFFKLKPGFNYCFGINYTYLSNNLKIGYFTGINFQSFKYKIKIFNSPDNNFKVSSSAISGFFSLNIPFGIRFTTNENLVLSLGIVPSYELQRLQSLYSYGISSQTIDSFTYTENVESMNKGYLNIKALVGVDFKVSERFYLYSNISTSFVKTPDLKYNLEIVYLNSITKLEGTASPTISIICLGVKYLLK